MAASTRAHAPHVSGPPLKSWMRRPASLRERTWMLIGIGAIAVGAGTIVAFAGALLTGGSTSEAIEAATWAFIGASISGFVAVASIPALRFQFLRREHQLLLEAASPMHPLMRQLMMEAPGTYSHSLAVADLAEATAEAVGADPLLARVGAYYHDVGKLRRPCFFFENQAGGENPHDEAKPSLSALIIAEHVPDGLDLSEQYRLPRRVREIIREHHGTSVIRYFYHKAAQADAAVVENDFRYHGGHPTSPEAAIVMLSDSSEAAVRALAEATPDKVESVVRAVTAEKRDDGQLLESGLTESDIETVMVTLAKGLVSSYHARCAYPRTDKGGRDADQRCEP